jgi:hypothetical protein
MKKICKFTFCFIEMCYYINVVDILLDVDTLEQCIFLPKYSVNPTLDDIWTAIHEYPH